MLIQKHVFYINLTLAPSTATFSKANWCWHKTFQKISDLKHLEKKYLKNSFSVNLDHYKTNKLNSINARILPLFSLKKSFLRKYNTQKV